MTDTDKLKRLAETLTAPCRAFDEKVAVIGRAEAGTILALIAENERLHMILDGKYSAVNDRAFIDAKGSE